MEHTQDQSLPLDEATESHRRPNESRVFEEYAAIIRRLRAPDGCPWDRKQTLDSLRNHIVEESFEMVAAINDASGASRAPDASRYGEVADELGDVFLVAMLLSDALDKESGISFVDVLRENGRKLLRRHPHVFSDTSVKNAEEVAFNWHTIKTEIEGKNPGPSGVSAGLPPLERAFEIQKKASKLGFDWDDAKPAIDKIHEEAAELAQAADDPDSSSTIIESEIGDLLFSVVNVARKLKVDPTVALDQTNRKFLSRFAYIEKALEARGMDVSSASLAEMDELWDESKRGN